MPRDQDHAQHARRAGRRAARAAVPAGAAVLAAVLLGAAGSPGAGTVGEAGSPGAGTAGEAGTVDGAPVTYVRAAHLVAGTGQVDLRLSPFSAEGDLSQADDPGLARTTGYGVVGVYSALAADTYAVTLTASGSVPGQQPLLEGTLQLEPGRAYTVVALGSAEAPVLQLLEDDLTPPPAGQSEVRLYSAVPGARVALDGGQVVQQAPSAPGTGYVAVPAGDRLLEVSDGTSSTSLQVGLASRASYTVFVTPGAEGDLGVQAVLDQAASEQVPVGGVATGGTWVDGAAPRTSGVVTVLGLLAAAGALALVVLRAHRPGRTPR